MGGDRPFGPQGSQGVERAPPRGRGSTHHVRGAARGRGGSPAWAGIDPRPRGCSSAPMGLPRVGGDRPWSPCREHRSAEAPPRGRGSTRPGLLLAPFDGGSPAWAGIDPRSRARSRRRPRLPRVGGDRPWRMRRRFSGLPAPPRGRGSTRRERARAVGAHGSPAWAGIDPATTRRRRASTGLPRVGGDRPYAVIDTAYVTVAPPRGRGSTRGHDRLPRRLLGSPAWAGIDPLVLRALVGARRLPRVGGDRPPVGNPAPDPTRAPPRGRGSTLARLDVAARYDGSPAWAGIDRGARGSSPLALWLPRVGGDRPAVQR